MWSWLANVIVAFLLIRFIVYPVLGIIMGTQFPIVAVISESMEHSNSNLMLCGQPIGDFKESFDNYWNVCGGWYTQKNITKAKFKSFPFRNGFDKGDIIIVWGTKIANIDQGDVIVFNGGKPQPIIHRVVGTWQENGQYFLQTKGDHNEKSISGFLGETKISENRLLGRGILRIPYMGWIKIVFVQAVKPLGWEITR